MATNETEFTQKMKRFFTGRAFIVTAVTLLVAVSVIIAATVSANRAKRPTGDDGSSAGTVTGEKNTQAAPSGKDEVTLPTYNGGETQPVGADPEEPELMLALPVTGQMFKGHDATLQVYSNTMGDYRIHLGVDIATAPEAPVFAAADGEVSKVWEDAMMGTCVAVTHQDNAVTIYKNMAKDLADGIAVGTKIERGQKLGTVGDTAVVEMADEPHLHFEVTVNGLAVNPLDYFSKADVEALSKDTAVESGAIESDSTSSGIRPDGK